MVDLSAEDVIEHLDLAPHPEGGFYRETYRDEGTLDSGRSFGTAIYYLLRAEDRSCWHRVDATEIWHWHGGGPLELSMRDGDEPARTFHLGTDFSKGQVPQFVVPANIWQSARPLEGWVLVGCTVAPGFEFSGFELAEDSVLPDC